jgi:predicted aldo/keto reductase-like oxidoreductase
MHFLIDEEEWQTAMGPGGALEAFIEAQEQGLVSFLGVTGHGLQVPSFHLRSLERYDFDSVLLPYSPLLMQDADYARGFENVAAICKERNVAMQTIKSIVRGPWGDKKQNRNTWYEPVEDQGDIDALVHWVLSRPDVFLITTGDVHLLPKVLDAVNRFDASATQDDFEEAIAEMNLEPLFT